MHENDSVNLLCEYGYIHYLLQQMQLEMVQKSLWFALPTFTIFFFFCAA